MKVQDSLRQQPAFDIPAGAWPMYKAQGYHQITEIKAEPPLEVKWSVSRGPVHGDYQYPPAIFWSAGPNNGHCESFKGTAHLSVKVYVPGQRPVTCPTHIADEYLRLFNEWASKSKKRKSAAVVEKVSASTPKVPGVSPYSGATVQPWQHGIEVRNK